MLKTQTFFRIAAGILLLLVSTPAQGCFWITGTTYKGGSKRVSGFGPALLLMGALNIDHREDGLQMQSALANSTNFNDRSDYAISLVYVGKTSEAVDLLKRLEAEQPGTYFVAANLGTALELLGRNEEALGWIREDMHRNPQSHEGTEWLHARILEAKIAAEKQPGYFKEHSVLELNPATVSQAITIDGQKRTPAEVAKAIQYQLEERLQFVKPPDPAVASLLFDYAAIEAATNVLETAKGLLKMSVDYGYPSDRVRAQMQLYNQKIAAAKTKRHIRNIVLGIAAIGLLILAGKAKVLLVRHSHPGSASEDRGLA